MFSTLSLSTFWNSLYAEVLFITFFYLMLMCHSCVFLNWQVAIFVVLAMVLRRKPDVLLGILPTLRENSKYQGQDKLPVIVWMAAQVSGSHLTPLPSAMIIFGSMSCPLNVFERLDNNVNVQASQGDLAVGLFSWAHNLLPIVGGKSSCNPQSRDLILQLVERFGSIRL